VGEGVGRNYYIFSVSLGRNRAQGEDGETE